MKREVFLVFVTVFLLGFVSSLSYSYNVTNVSIKENYSTSENLSGSFDLTLKNAPLDLAFSSSLGKINIRDFLKNISKPVSCESTNCIQEYTAAGNGYSSLSFSIQNNTRKEFAILIQDSAVSVNNLTMQFSSDFPESTSIPFTLNLADTYSFSYQAFSTNFNRQTSYGCYSDSSSSQEKNLDYVGYCERMNLESSDSFLVGANISGSGQRNFVFSLKDSTFLEVASCEFSTSSSSYSSDSSCILETNVLQAKGEYYVCIAHKIEGDSGYKVKFENSGTNCGGYGSSAYSSPSGDYSIYAKVPKYSAGSSFSFLADETANGVLNNYIQTRYNNNCTAGCVIPFAISGVTQNLDIDSFRLDYSSNTGASSINKFYNLSKKESKYNFSGIIPADSFLWKITENKNFSLYLENSEGKPLLFNKTLRVSVNSQIDSLTPLNPPAGIETTFFADVKLKGNSSKYEWDFGDGSPIFTSSQPFATHKYTNLSSYSLRLAYSNSNSSTFRVFNITTISPKDSLNLTFNLKRSRLSKANNDINTMPTLYRTYLLNKIKLEDYQNELNRLDIARAGAYTSEEYLTVATELSEMIVPWTVYSIEKKTGPMYSDYKSFDASIVEQENPSGADNPSEYNAAIFEWQMQNTVSTATKQKIALVKEDNSVTKLITTYDISVASKSSEESYLVIQESFENINPSSGVNIQKVGGASLIVLNPGESLSFSFFVEGDKDVVFYVAPKLDSLNPNQEIGICNFNLVCEKGLNENYKNCRSDCKPIWPTIWWLVFIIFIALIIYTMIQVWYKVRYEKYLFNDRAGLFNLVMFVNNARLNGMSNKDIEKSLAEKGWSKEQIEYAMRKAEGKNPGMFEIIPIDKVIANMEKRKAEKNKQNKLAPPINHYPTQINRNGGNIITGNGQQRFPKA